MTDRNFIQEARDGYQGTPHRIARCSDQHGEEHVIVEMRTGDRAYWLDWIGADLAVGPDEWDELPFTGLRWRGV